MSGPRAILVADGGWERQRTGDDAAAARLFAGRGRAVLDDLGLLIDRMTENISAAAAGAD